MTVELCEIQTLMFNMFTSPHNQLFFSSQTSMHLSLYVLCFYMFLLLLFGSISVSLLFVSFIFVAVCLQYSFLFLISLVFFSSPLYSACPESFNICSLWDKKNNPEPWNKLDPTYQYKVTTPQSTAERPHACSFRSAKKRNNSEMAVKSSHSSSVYKPTKTRPNNADKILFDEHGCTLDFFTSAQTQK